VRHGVHCVEGPPYSALVAPGIVYRERLRAPCWAWPAAVALAAFVATELALGAPALRHPITYAVTTVLALAGVWALSRITIAVDDGHLYVDDARLPRSVISAVTVVDAAGRRDLLGPEADPLAFVITRPWIPGGVCVDLDDPDDPTPYWFISSRHPERLAAALRPATAASSATPSSEAAEPASA
jgi:hypothetical protein